MKEYLLVLGCLFSLGIGYAQFGPKQDIANDADGARSIFLADIDGDSIKDVVSANKFSSSITWYKHLDGHGDFGSQTLVASVQEPIHVYVADFNGDAFNDILTTAPAPGFDDVIWYENLDGLGNFGPGNVIYDGSSVGVGAYIAIAADIDGDSDMDIVMGSDSDGLHWFENLDGQGNFSPAIEINAAAPNSRSVMAVDLDGDTDLDILASSSGSVTVSWYKNLDGQGGFGSQRVIAGNAATVQDIYAADLDGDDDNDVLAATNGLSKVAWFENINGGGTFGSEQIITLSAQGARSVFAADLDNDEDIDVVSGSSIDGKIAWYENLDESEQFSDEMIIALIVKGPLEVDCSDLDNDGDMDVFSASQNDDTLAWYENLTILGVEEFDATMVEIVPNPVDNILSIRSEIAIDEVVVYDVLGKELLRKKGNVNELNVSGLPSGLLFLELITPQGLALEKVVKE